MSDRSHGRFAGRAIGLIALLALVPLPASAGDETARPASHGTISAAAQQVHESGFLFDGHNDLPWAIRKLADGSLERLDIARPQAQLQTDIPRLRQSGLKAQFWSVYVSADTIATGDALLQTRAQVELVHAMIARYPETFEMAATAQDVERIARSGRIASMIGVEGGHSLENRLEVLQQLYDRGARYMTLTHSRTLDWADAATDKPRHGGLNDFGEQVIREMNRLGMLVDLSHVSVDTMRDALDISQAPVIFSHSSCRAICDHPRNVPDEILKRLPQNGGVIMINFYSGFIVPTADLKQDKETRGTLAMVVDHLDHAVRVAGPDHVGIGSDFDGVDRLPVGVEDVAVYPAITAELLRRGHSPEVVHKILGGNIMRVLKQAEEVARRMDAD